METQKRRALNGLRHGLRSMQIVLPGEAQADLDELIAGYREDYAAADASVDLLILDLVKQHWFSLRAEDRFLDMEFALEKRTAMEWTPEEHTQYSLLLWYKTMIDRGYARAFSKLEGFVGRRFQRQMAERKADLVGRQIAAKMRIDLRKDERAAEKEAWPLQRQTVPANPVVWAARAGSGGPGSGGALTGFRRSN